MELIRLKIKEISYSQTQTGAYALILEEEKGNRKLPIIIGNFEAQSIALALESDLQPPRPLTHDLLVNIVSSFQIEVKAVYIYKLEDGVFFSYLECQSLEDGKTINIDSRTSDAIAIAVRFDAPIYVKESVMNKAGIILKFSQEESVSTSQEEDFFAELEKELIQNNPISKFDHKDIEELKVDLQKALEYENYQLAAEIRDEISKRK
ncbi:MAG: hypothetical protein C4K58_08040 [Flavobacteriaceae bacterium]|nr:MAG: hypothetical protein C4K58_08040 [Flavobacteriaceae bacterium]